MNDLTCAACGRWRDLPTDTAPIRCPGCGAGLEPLPPASPPKVGMLA